ncbi:PQQ-dependent sugar dehydrogenase [Chloroflexota bacterium]
MLKVATGRFCLFVVITCLSAVVTMAACAAPQPLLPALQPEETPVISDETPAAIQDVEVVAAGLDTPWAIDFATDGRIFLTERPGRVRIIKNGRLLDEPWFAVDIARGGESGLLGLALDHHFGQNRFVYLAYTYRDENGRFRNRLVRLKDDPSNDKGEVDRILVDGVLGASNHDGGRVRFGPDDKLYWTTGDAQDAELAQDLTSLNGKILRLNTDGTVPGDNPFPGSMIYSYGHRNPQGLAWQPGTEHLYATEHGPSGFQGSGQDEVNYIQAGNNYGWPAITGDEVQEGMVSPVIQSGRSETWAPGGAAFVVGGPWDGSLLFVGLRGQTLYRLSLDINEPEKALYFDRLLSGEYGRLRDVAQGPDGAIYILTSNRDGRGNPEKDDDKVLRLVVR